MKSAAHPHPIFPFEPPPPWKDEMELHITFHENRACLWDLAYEDYIIRKERTTISRSQFIRTRIFKDSSPDFLGSQFITTRMCDPLSVPKQYFLA